MKAKVTYAVLLLCAMTSLGASHVGRGRNAHRFQALRDLVWLDTEWILAFRLTSGVQRSAYESFTGTDNDDQPLFRVFLPPACLVTHASSACCDQHYRSALLNSWPSRYIDKVRVSLMKGGVEVAHVLFNGTGSSLVGWFSADRVLSSSWTDLTSEPHNYFSIQGHHKPSPSWHQHSRRFYIFRNYGGCPLDNGWLSVQDRNVDVCRWGNLKDTHPFPAILYSTKTTYVNFNTNDVGRADALVVAVKLLPLDQLLVNDDDRHSC